MSRTEPPQVLNFDNLETKRRFMQKVQKLRGLQEVSIHPRKLTRSLNQNAYWHAAVVEPFKEWLREQWGDNAITHEQAHELLKRKVLGPIEKVDESTGEIYELTPTSHDMDSAEFGDLIEKSSAWMAEFCGIVVLSSDLFFESK
jgi:hypothetical protein